jgi:hypothetical protein
MFFSERKSCSFLFMANKSVIAKDIGCDLGDVAFKYYQGKDMK